MGAPGMHARTKPTRGKIAALAVVAASTLALVGVVGPAAAATTTTYRVDETSLVASPASAVNGHWTVVDQTGSGQLVFVDGPAAPPLGIGSLQLSVTAASDKIDVFNYDWYTKPVSDLAAMSFWTYTSDTILAPAFQIQAFLNDVGPNSHYTTINFEPYVMGAVTPNVWQPWTITGSTLVWATRLGSLPGSAGFPESWSAFRATYPNATMIAVGFNAGSGVSAFSANADDLSITTTLGDTTIYNFEHAVILAGKTACMDGGWRTSTSPVFRNQGACVSYFASDGKSMPNG